MSKVEKELFCYVNYYAKNDLYGHIVKRLVKHLKKTDDTVFRYWCCVGWALSGSIAKSRKELLKLKNLKTPFRTCVLGTLIEIYRMSDDEDEDEEEIDLLTMDYNSAKENGDDLSAIHLSLFHCYIGNFSEAREIVEEVNEEYEDKYVTGVEAKGWVYLLGDKDLLTFECESIFERHYESALFLLGKVEFYKVKKEYEQCMSILSKLMATRKTLYVSHIEKANICILQNKWVEANAICENLIKKKSPRNFDAVMIHLVYLITTENKIKLVNQKFSLLMKIIRSYEAKNHKLLFKVAKIFGSICGNNKLIMGECLKCVRGACKIQPIESEYVTLIGDFLLRIGQFKEALMEFNRAIELDESNINANMGLTKAYVYQKQYEDAQDILESLNELKDTFDAEDDTYVNVAELSYLEYMIEWYYKKNRNRALEKLYESVSTFTSSIESISFSLMYYARFDPSFLLNVCRELLKFCPVEPIFEYNLPTKPLVKFGEVLRLLLKTIPGSLEGQFLLARYHYLKHEFDESVKLISICATLDTSFYEVYMLQAEIMFRQKKYKLALNSAEIALSKNFKIKNDPSYNLLEARSYKCLNEETKALNILNSSMTRLKRKKTLTPEYELRYNIELGLLYASMKKRKECMKHLKKAKVLGNQLGDRDRLIFVESKIRLKFGEHMPALNILENISPKSEYYKRAVQKRAKINLKYMKNHQKYISLFEQLLESNETKDNLLQLAGAYMSIHEPEKAIELYKRALNLDTKNYKVMRLIGEALVTTHQFTEAIEYYKIALQTNPQEFDLRTDLTELYILLRMYKEGKELMHKTQREMQDKRNPKPATLKRLVKCVEMLAKIEEKNKNYEEANGTLERAVAIQESLLLQLRGMEEEEREQKVVIAGIQYKLGMLEKKLKNRAMVQITHFNRSVEYFNEHEQSLTELSTLHVQRGDTLTAEKYATQILKINPKNEKAIMVLADIKFRKKMYIDAVNLFQKLLASSPRNFGVLEKLLMLLRKYGQIQHCMPFLERAKCTDGGYHFCMGLYHRFRRQYDEAIFEFFKARTSDKWFEKATFNMIELYLAQELNFLNPWESLKNARVNRKNLESAEKLILELRSSKKLKIYTFEKISLLEAYVMIARGKVDKVSIEKAVEFLRDKTKEKGAIAIFLGIVTAQIIGKQDYKKLKRTIKKCLGQQNDISKLYDDELERCRMIMAHYLVKQNQQKDAKDVLSIVLKKNQSCAEANELMGLIYESELNFDESSKYYEKAWKLSDETNCEIAYKLAFNYLKGKSYVAAMEVCHKVLNYNPNYVKIKSQILVKCRERLRP